VIEALSCDWDPDSYHDRYRARLKRIVDRKRKAKTVKVPEDGEQPTPPSDLMEALERTLAGLKSRRLAAKRGGSTSATPGVKRDRWPVSATR
jgi:DNA end-binding protein Ku